MILRIDVKPQHCQYAQQIKKNKAPAYYSDTNKNQNNISFAGLGSSSRKLLKAVKAHIPHSVVGFSGPSGTGKTSIMKRLMETDTTIKKAVSYTTRDMRPNEINGVDYHFITQTKFDGMNKRGEFYQIQEVRLGGKSYGGTLKDIDSKRKGGNVFIDFTADVASKVKKIYGKNAVLIFIDAPNQQELIDRFIRRGVQMSEEAKQERIADGFKQREYYHLFDKVIINDNFDVAVKEITEYIKSRRSFAVRTIDNLIDYFKKNQN